MKILHIHPSLNTGGIEAMINALANEMVKTDDVEVCSIFTPSDTNHLWQSLDSRIAKTTIGKNAPGFSVSEICKIYRHIRRGKYDVVQIHGFFMYYILAILFLGRRTKFFYTVHSDAYMENSHWDKRFLWFKKLAFKTGLLNAVTISQASKESFYNLYRTDSTLIPNGIAAPQLKYDKKPSVDRYRFTSNTRVLIHIGRIDTPKNQIAMCQAFDKVLSAGHDAVLLIAGPVANKEIFNGLRKYFSDRIIYLGEINEAREWLAACDAMLLPSIWEGLPVTLLEAMSVGCIPICSPVGGIVNVIENETDGFLLKSSSMEDIAEGLEEYMSCPEETLKEMNRNAKNKFNRYYGVETTSKAYQSLYKSKLCNSR